MFPHVLIDQAHSTAWAFDLETAATMNPANPADASIARAVEVLRSRGCTVDAHRSGRLTADTLASADVLVIDHLASPKVERVTGDLPATLTDAEIDALEEHVASGGGLVVLGECDQDSYDTNIGELLARFGLSITSTRVVEGSAEHRFRGNDTWELADLDTEHARGILAGVDQICFYRAGVLADPAASGAGRRSTVLARTTETAHPKAAPLAIAHRHGKGRVVVLTDSDLVGDDCIGDLDHERFWENIVTWAAGGRAAAEGQVTETSETATLPDWVALKTAVEELRLMQAANGALADDADRDRAGELVTEMTDRITALAPRFEHDAAYLEALVADLAKWRDGGYGEPDFLDSLVEFRPEKHRTDGLEHLVVFPMYTQNGNPDRVFEAVLLNVVWPDWLADVEATYDNKAFLAVTFLDFTPGYDTNSAVLFPETVAVREVPQFSWGAIFCDREAARFRRIVSDAAEILKLDLPPDAERLVASQDLAQNTFAMWDLIHDRTHSHGDLPFDPFMIKQRMPFWMYSLEELRCDLNTFREATTLEEQGHPYARMLQHAILFDRLIRFPITGDRNRNYDGLGGQLLFAWLHQAEVLHWTNNELTLDWRLVPGSILELCEAVNDLYRTGIDRSRVGHWIAAYEFVSSYVAPHPGSTWAKGADALPLSEQPRKLVDLVEKDEFPLNVFYEALRKKLKPSLEATKGITGTTRTTAS